MQKNDAKIQKIRYKKYFQSIKKNQSYFSQKSTSTCGKAHPTLNKQHLIELITLLTNKNVVLRDIIIFCLPHQI